MNHNYVCKYCGRPLGIWARRFGKARGSCGWCNPVPKQRRGEKLKWMRKHPMKDLR